MDLATQVCRQLRLHYGTRAGDEKKYEYYHQLWNKYQHLDDLENKAELKIPLHTIFKKLSASTMQGLLFIFLD